MDVRISGFIKSGGLRNKFKNCIEIIPERQHKGSLTDPNTSASRLLNNKRYSVNALRTIGNQVQHEHRLRILPFGVISRVRSLKLNRKLLQYNKPTRPSLHSSASKDSYLQLSVPKTKCKTFADWSFSVGAPSLWNLLPQHIKEANLVLMFKNMVKTHLFMEAFPD